MKYLILSQGKQAIIDDEDFEFLNIGLYELKEDAIKARQKAEIKYFGEYSALAGLSQ